MRTLQLGWGCLLDTKPKIWRKLDSMDYMEIYVELYISVWQHKSLTFLKTAMGKI